MVFSLTYIALRLSRTIYYHSRGFALSKDSRLTPGKICLMYINQRCHNARCFVVWASTYPNIQDPKSDLQPTSSPDPTPKRHKETRQTPEPLELSDNQSNARLPSQPWLCHKSRDRSPQKYSFERTLKSWHWVVRSLSARACHLWLRSCIPQARRNWSGLEGGESTIRTGTLFWSVWLIHAHCYSPSPNIMALAQDLLKKTSGLCMQLR